jgi:hypothetical protein
LTGPVGYPGLKGDRGQPGERGLPGAAIEVRGEPGLLESISTESLNSRESCEI